MVLGRNRFDLLSEGALFVGKIAVFCKIFVPFFVFFEYKFQHLHI
jgi:hypothetical protein